MPLTYQFRTPNAISEVCFSWETNPPSKICSTDPSSMSVSSSKSVVASAAESEVAACFHNTQSGAPLRVTLTKLPPPPTPLRTDNMTAFIILNETIKQKQSKQWTCNTIGWQTESAINNLTFIGAQDVKISEIITENIIQHNITKTCEDYYYIKQIVFRFCEGVLNYSHSRNPRCAPVRTHRQIQAPREPPN
jgi:hypothetical protein